MTAQVTEFSRWRHSLICTWCEEGEVCRCPDAMKTRLWLLTGTTGAIQHFHCDGPFYGTWREGRTGAMESLDGCKAAVEKAVRP